MTTAPGPLDPDTSEADETQLALARAEGEAYGRSLTHMVEEVAHDGAVLEAGPYLVAYAVEDAEGMYAWMGDDLVWQNPGSSNVHLEVAVRDAADGRFVPGLTVHATLVSPDGEDAGTHVQELVWHPMLYHYGRNWELPGDGSHTLRVRIDPAPFMRHDEVNGRRFMEPVDVTFSDVRIERGAEPVEPPD